nr:LEAF RUST 10 DISEASE-RESISTANCE LOCUS RECEPTOR-LIKE PROTEIN KINASE-like 1.2 isoform X2 [Ipomoea batatas]
MFPSPFFLVFTVFFFIKSNAAYEDVAVLFGENHCHPPSPCKKGNFEIKYPFWKLDDSSSTVCGYPGFGIDCSNPDPDFPLLYLSDDSFLVKEINYDEFSVTLADADAYKKECPRARHNFTLTQKSPLLYDHKDLNLTFYFNCTKNPLPAAYPIDCLKSDPKASYLYVGAFNPYNWDWLGICEAKVETTVIETGEVINDKNFGRDMSNGFKLNWQPLDDCAHCDIPKGWCEQDNHFREFLCFCENGTTVIVPDCPSKGKKLGLKIGLAIGGAAFGFIVCFCLFAYLRRQKKRSVSSSYLMSRSVPSNPSSSTIDLEGGSNYHGVPLFDYTELEEATNSFDARNELGDGGFGTVYKGEKKHIFPLSISKVV